MCTMVASLNKIILWEKKILPLWNKKSHYNKNRKVRGLLDTPDPKDKMPTIQLQSLRPLRARVQLINTRKSEWYYIMG